MRLDVSCNLDRNFSAYGQFSEMKSSEGKGDEGVDATA